MLQNYDFVLMSWGRQMIKPNDKLLFVVAAIFLQFLFYLFLHKAISN